MTDEDETIKRQGDVLRKGGHRKGSSGEHPIMQAVRKKQDEIREGTLPELQALNARIDRIKVLPPSPLPEENELDESIVTPSSPLPEEDKLDES